MSNKTHSMITKGASFTSAGNGSGTGSSLSGCLRWTLLGFGFTETAEGTGVAGVIA